MANKELGNILRAYRTKKNYKQQEVADILGLKNKSTLGNRKVRTRCRNFLKIV